ncbi:AfsR/SARP family transcriptional regulator [Rhizomonospora bruguierae]|uniref:AfsR/SARP family transcriptional regulator n=1 Tax=Rhizomonospora bruguierae TaxID=1581705 RepID=UPI001BCD2CF6|nr:BTAD domain-containing putative transcriptional regulator [Micromonospora sp. NBRC 107566]
MRFRILGPLAVAADTGGPDLGPGAGEPAITAARDRIVLAALLLRPNRVVDVDQLVDAVWGDHPPATARGQLQTCVSRLRRAFARLGIPEDAILTDPVGYLLRVSPHELDSEVFARLVGQAGEAAAAARWDEARELLRSALDLWRGPALAGMGSRLIRQGASALDEQRAVALEDCAEAELNAGREREVVAELTDLVERYPLRERLRALLMIALYRAGRAGDALAAYRQARQALAGELGIEPGPALQHLHQRILRGDRALAAGLSPGTDPPPPPPPRTLPRGATDFTGRAAAVTRLLDAIERAPAGTPVVRVIDGMPGSGKTTLAVHLGHLLAGRYPDGQLFVDLHGHSERDPMDPGTALTTLLRQLGVPGDRVPADVDERAALWRAELSTRRLLVVLDNAGSSAQVAPLLPAAPGVLVLVTSRRRLLGLDGVQPEPLPALSAGEAVRLLATVAGEGRVRAEPAAAAEVVRRCGYLPLAIRLAGARLAHRPRWRIADLADRLARDRAVLPELAAEHRTVASAFHLSYAQLTPAAQRMFRLLGLHPGEDFDSYAVAALTGLSHSEAEDLVDELADGHLVEEPVAGRFRLHDLVREYARQLVAATDGEPDRRLAAAGLLDFYLDTANVARREIENTGQRGVETGPPSRPDLVKAAATSGREWLAAERRNLIAAVRCAAEWNLLEHVWRLARAVWRSLYVSGHIDELVETQRRAVAAAEALGDEQALAVCLNYLASGYFRLSRPQDSIDCLHRTLDLWRRLRSTEWEARVHKNLAVAYTAGERYPEAIEHAQEAQRLWRRDPVPAHLTAMPNSLIELARLSILTGRYADGLEYARRIMLITRQRGDSFTRAESLEHAGAARSRLGDHRPAIALLTAALAMKRQHGMRYGEGDTLNELGRAHRAAGDPGAALRYHHQALVATRGSTDSAGECASLNHLGAVLADLGDPAAALARHREALDRAARAGHRTQIALALAGIAHCTASADPEHARNYYLRAVELLTELGLPERDAVGRALADLPAGPA